MKKALVMILAISLLLSGCGSWMTGEYHSVSPHKVKEQSVEQTIPSVSDYNQLRNALEDLVEAGATTGRLSVEEYRASALESNMLLATEDIKKNHPIGAYAVEDISYELGTTGGLTAIAVTIRYTRDPEELQNIKPADNMEKAKELITDALSQCDSAVVFRVQNYEKTDLVQLVEDYAAANPDLVMEVPQVAVSVYPESGKERVVDLRFVYQTNRESLRQMQNYVQPVFTSAALYVSSEEESNIVKFARLYTFLMERNDYKVETSITPAYSLLRHGVGDNRAFSQVYAAMCRKAGLECLVVTGTHNGEARFWNIIFDGQIYYHVDLLSPSGFIIYSDHQMNGYVWDYSAYPACGVVQQPTTGQTE